MVSAGIWHRNKVNSTAWLYRPWDGIIYITLHYIHVGTYIDKQLIDILFYYLVNTCKLNLHLPEFTVVYLGVVGKVEAVPLVCCAFLYGKINLKTVMMIKIN